MSDPLVQIQINGAGLGIIYQQVYAGLVPGQLSLVTWVVTTGPDGSLVFTDQASGLVLSDASTTAGTGMDRPSPAVVAPAGSGLPVTSWKLVQFSDEGGDPAVITDPSRLASGYYTLQDPGSGNFLFRNRAEDRSLLPKYVGLQDPSAGPFELIIQVISD